MKTLTKEEILKLGKSGLKENENHSDCSDCRVCSYCYKCSGLKNEKYFVKNIKLTKEEYESFMSN